MSLEARPTQTLGLQLYKEKQTKFLIKNLGYQIEFIATLENYTIAIKHSNRPVTNEGWGHRGDFKIFDEFHDRDGIDAQITPLTTSSISSYKSVHDPLLLLGKVPNRFNAYVFHLRP